MLPERTTVTCVGSNDSDVGWSGGFQERGRQTEDVRERPGSTDGRCATEGSCPTDLGDTAKATPTVKTNGRPGTAKQKRGVLGYQSRKHIGRQCKAYLKRVDRTSQQERTGAEAL